MALLQQELDKCKATPSVTKVWHSTQKLRKFSGESADLKDLIVVNLLTPPHSSSLLLWCHSGVTPVLWIRIKPRGYIVIMRGQIIIFNESMNDNQ